MWMFIGLLSFVAMFVFLIMSLVAKIKKTGKAKKMLLSAVGCFVLLIAAISFDGPSKNQPATTQVSEDNKEEKKDEEKAKEEEKSESEKAAEEEAENKAKEEAAAKKAEEDAAKRKAKDEAKLKAEQKAKAKAEAEAKKKAEEEAKAKAVAEAEAKKKSEAEKPENVLKKAVVKALGKKSNRDLDKVTKVSVNEQSGAVTVQFAGDDNFSEKMIVSGIKMDIEKVLEAVRKSKINYKELNISVTFSMVDKLGNAKESEVVSLVYYKETIDKINFDNFLYDNVFDITDIPPFIHPAFRVD
ncbi:hypothetical protein ACFWGC_27615 [Cytobacillus pseudoceanisediminis]|uniref:hypothetical protein n=1 Tax=Cytobacillus pseudoceanisediminis TaxID=3051614 RepID=UPI00365011BA